MNPYLILGIPRNAEDRLIRQAYLDAIKAASPETHPERFKLLTKAYEKIKDEPSRLKFQLFDKDCPGDSPAEVFFRYARCTKTKPLTFAALKTYLQSCSSL